VVRSYSQRTGDLLPTLPAVLDTRRTMRSMEPATRTEAHSEARSADSLRHRLIGLADLPTDDDDLRLRKRVGVVIGYVHVLAPAMLPILAGGLPLSWAVAIGMPLICAINLAVLARTHNFDRYVAVLILLVLSFGAAVEIGLGGVAGSSANLVFSFLGPVYAILGLGPRRATRWFAAYVVMVVAVLLLDPVLSSQVPIQPYSARLLFYGMNLIIPLGFIFGLLRYTDIRRREAEARVDELLTNAIPPSIAARLKRGETRIAESYPETTVLFADVVGFTPWAQSTPPARVIDVLDVLFSRFDELAATHGVEKLKTIGDEYMAVAGAPEPKADHAVAAVALARDMLAALANARKQLDIPLELRIGIASGPVVGGVIGRRRILFDLWGSTVNLASRMQSSGVPGRIQVASSTQALLLGKCEFEERGSVELKGLGQVATFLLRDPLVVHPA
jgi:adenylate cyclase